MRFTICAFTLFFISTIAWAKPISRLASGMVSDVGTAEEILAVDKLNSDATISFALGIDFHAFKRIKF